MRTRIIASGRFEAARRIENLPAAHRARQMHGHGFRASVVADAAASSSPFPGGEVTALRERLAGALRPLDYSDLNRTMLDPSDENIARWLCARLGLGAEAACAIQSTRDRGVHLGKGASMTVWRRYRFEAAHRLPRVPAGHKCARMHGHGFQAVAYAGLDAATSSCIGYDALDEAWAPLHTELHGGCLNELAGLENPTSEMIAAWIWRRLRTDVPGLTLVAVYETGSCGASYDGRDYRLWKDFSLDSAVRLKRAPASAKAGALHGHTFALRLHLSAPLDAAIGWMLDFADVTRRFSPVFEALDHRALHELPGLVDADAATIAAWTYDKGKVALPQLAGVELYETEGCGAGVASGSDIPALPLA